MIEADDVLLGGRNWNAPLRTSASAWPAEASLPTYLS
jgi:hypothetical protein